MQISVKQNLEHNNNDDNNNILSRTRCLYAIKRNGSKCKYVEIITHHVGSIGAPSRRIKNNDSEESNFLITVEL
jgi:hypothetical protein